jgi:hypothetical protein
MKKTEKNSNPFADKMKALGEKINKQKVKKEVAVEPNCESKEIKTGKKEPRIRKLNTVRTNYEINRGIIDGLIKRKTCTLLTNPFDCGKLKGYDLKKGKEKWCHCPDFVNCPGFNQYASFEVKKNRRNVSAGNEAESD